MEDNKIHGKDQKGFESLTTQAYSTADDSTDSATSETGEEISKSSIDGHSVHLDYDSNIKLADTFFNLPKEKNLKTMMVEIEEKEDEIREKGEKDFERLIGKVTFIRGKSYRNLKTSKSKEIKHKDQIVVHENDSGSKPQIGATSNPLHYNQLANIKYETMTEPHYPSAPHTILTGNQPQSVQSPIHMQSQLKDQIVVHENDSGSKPQIGATSNPPHYNHLPDIKYETMTEPHYPSAPHTISTENQPRSVQTPIHTQSQRPLKSLDLYNYNQQQNRDFTSRHQMQLMPNSSKQFLLPFQSKSANQQFPQTYAVQKKLQMINSSSNQHSSPQHLVTAHNSILTEILRQQCATPAPQQHVTTSLTKYAIQATQPVRNPTVVRPKNLSLPMTNAPNPDCVFIPANRPGVNNTRSKSRNSTVLLPATSRQQYATPAPQQHVTTSLTKCGIQTTQLAILQRYPPVLPRNPTVVRPKNLSLPKANAPNPNGVFTPAIPSNQPGVNNARSKYPNSTMLLPATYSKVIDVSTPPVSENEDVIRSLEAIVDKHTGKERCENVQQMRHSKYRDLRKLHLARECVIGMKVCDFDFMDSDRNNYLHAAVCRTDIYMLEALLEQINIYDKRYLIDRQNNLLRTPLYLAVSLNKPDMVRILISYGANINLEGMTRGYTTEVVECAPIHCAASLGKEYYDTLKELCKSENMNPDILNSNGLSALHCAIRKHGKLAPHQNYPMTKIDNCQNISFLLQNKANPNLQDRQYGKTPLMYAIESKDYTIVDAIVNTVDSSMIPELLQAETFDGRTCMDIAGSLRNEFDPHTWKRLHNFLSSVK